MKTAAADALVLAFVLIMALVIVAGEVARPIMRARRQVADEGADSQ